MPVPLVVRLEGTNVQSCQTDHIREHADDPVRCIRRRHVLPLLRSVPLSAGAVVREKSARSLASLLRGRCRTCPPFPGHILVGVHLVKLRPRSHCNFHARSSLAALCRDDPAFRLGGGAQTCTHADIRPAPVRSLTGRRYEVSASAPLICAVLGFAATAHGRLWPRPSNVAGPNIPAW